MTFLYENYVYVNQRLRAKRKNAKCAQPDLYYLYIAMMQSSDWVFAFRTQVLKEKEIEKYPNNDYIVI